MAGLQARTAEEGLELTALSTGGDSTSEEPLEPSQSPSLIDNAQSRPSLSDSYDIENADICTAAIRNIPRASASDRIWLRVREIKSNKIARRTLQVTVIIGALTVLYQFASLFPAFQNWLAASRGLEVQIQGVADSKQSLVYEFLTFCENRKSQNRPLGPDCEKYLGAYPKAPPGTEKWILPQGTYSRFYPALTPRAIGVAMKQPVALAVASMVDQRFLNEILKWAGLGLYYWKAVRFLSGTQLVLVCIFTGILTIPVLGWIVVPVSEFVGGVAIAGLVCLFSMISSVVRRGGVDEGFKDTITYGAIGSLALANRASNTTAGVN